MGDFLLDLAKDFAILLEKDRELFSQLFRVDSRVSSKIHGVGRGFVVIEFTFLEEGEYRGSKEGNSQWHGYIAATFGNKVADSRDSHDGVGVELVWNL